jgi:hypothetical protein
MSERYCGTDEMNNLREVGAIKARTMVMKAPVLGLGKKGLKNKFYDKRMGDEHRDSQM